MKRIAFLAIIAVLATQGITSAQKTQQGRGKGAAHIFEKLDANGDGGITLEEMRAHHEERRREVDLNGDGKVTPEEIRQLHQQRAAEHFAQIDVNADGVLSRDEVPERLQRHFDKVDANGDGAISQDEMLNGKYGKHHGKGPGKGKGEYRGKGPEQAGNKGVPIDPEVRLQERFEQMDANHDGVITLEELQQGKGPRGGHGKKGPRK